MCTQAGKNIREVQDAADELGLNLVLVEPQLLAAILNSELRRADRIKNYTRAHGLPRVVHQEDGIVHSWKNGQLVVDLSLPLAMYMPMEDAFCHKQRTSFAFFKEDGTLTSDGKRMASKVSTVVKFVSFSGVNPKVQLVCSELHS